MISLIFDDFVRFGGVFFYFLFDYTSIVCHICMHHDLKRQFGWWKWLMLILRQKMSMTSPLVALSEDGPLVLSNGFVDKSTSKGQTGYPRLDEIIWNLWFETGKLLAQGDLRISMSFHAKPPLPFHCFHYFHWWHCSCCCCFFQILEPRPSRVAAKEGAVHDLQSFRKSTGPIH